MQKTYTIILIFIFSPDKSSTISDSFFESIVLELICAALSALFIFPNTVAYDSFRLPLLPSNSTV